MERLGLGDRPLLHRVRRELRLPGRVHSALHRPRHQVRALRNTRIDRKRINLNETGF